MFDPLLDELQLSIKARGAEKLFVPKDLEEKKSLKGDGIIRSLTEKFAETSLDTSQKIFCGSLFPYYYVN